ncbi:MAG: nucleoside hydrolase [Promethearchaeota archaeon]
MRILVDTDPGLGLRFTDVDDGLALFLMLNNLEFEIEGITTVFGNTPVNRGYALLKKYLKLAKRTNIPHKMGAMSKHYYGKKTEASQFLIDIVKENPKELILLTLGPLTNIATALLHYPDLFNNLKKIVIMGGTLSPITSFNPFFKGIDRRFFNKIKIKQIVSEFNFFNDPLSTKKVIEAETKTQRIEMGLDICCKAIFKNEHFRRIKSIKKPIPQFIARHIKFWLNLWKLNGNGGFFPFDTFVPIFLLEPNLFKKSNLYLSIDTKKIPGKLSIIKKKTLRSAPITYCTNFIDSNSNARFMEILISNLIA